MMAITPISNALKTTRNSLSLNGSFFVEKIAPRKMANEINTKGVNILAMIGDTLPTRFGLLITSTVAIIGIAGSPHVMT
jgi:hypothetical protein